MQLLGEAQACPAVGGACPSLPTAGRRRRAAEEELEAGIGTVGMVGIKKPGSDVSKPSGGIVSNDPKAATETQGFLLLQQIFLQPIKTALTHSHKLNPNSVALYHTSNPGITGDRAKAVQP